MMHRLSALEEDLQAALSDAWIALVALLSVSSHRVPKGALWKILGGLGLAEITDTIVGVPAVVEAAAALLPVDVELTVGAPLMLSGIASAVLIMTGFAADLSRPYANGLARTFLAAAALVPIGVVVTLASIYAAQLLSLTAEDGIRADALVKLLVPALGAIAAHLIVFCNSQYFFDALQQRADGTCRPRLMVAWKKLRAIAADYVAVFTERQHALGQLMPFGNAGADVAMRPSCQAELYFEVAKKLLEPGDPIEILVALRKKLHGAATPADTKSPTDDVSRDLGGTVVTAAAQMTAFDAPGQPHGHNGSVPGLVVTGALAGLLLLPSIADANRVPVRTSGQAYRVHAGTPAQTAPSTRPRGEVYRPPVPRLQQSPTPEKIAQRRQELPTSRTWFYTANLSQTRAQSRSGHRAAGNRQLARAMAHDEALSRRVRNKFGRDAHDRLRRGRNPRGAEWDHSEHRKNFLQLMTKSAHAKVTKRQGRAGGGMKKFWPKAARRGARR